MAEAHPDGRYFLKTSNKRDLEILGTFPNQQQAFLAS
jgi:hypothetical protein